MIPGAAELRPAIDAVDQWGVFVRSDSGDTVTRQTRTLRIEVRGTEGPAAPLITLTRAHPPSSTFGDTILMRRVGLAPVREKIRAGGRRADIQYLGDSVHSVNYVGDSVVRVTARRYPYAPFSFNQLETVITRLPLRLGYRATLPLYSVGDDSVEVDTVSVLGVTAGDRPRWRVRFADRSVIITYMVDTLSRRISGVEQAFNRNAPGRRAFWIAEPLERR